MRDLLKDKAMIEDFILMLGGSNYSEPLALHAIDRAIAAEAKVEEMQKTLEWYAESNIKDIFDDMGDRARQALEN